MSTRVNHLHLLVMKYGWVLEIIIYLPIGFPINNIISLWVGEVNVNDFFESMSTSTVNIDRKTIFFGMRAHRRAISTDFFWYESISTVDFDRFLGEIDGRSSVLDRSTTPVHFLVLPGSVCCFVLLNRYWGIVTVPGSFLKVGDLGWPNPHPSP